MKLLRFLIYRLFRGQVLRSPCSLRVEFTGESPRNSSEELIKKIAGSRKLVSLRWLEEQIANTLYCAELPFTWVLDVGVWGPVIYSKEAAIIVAGMHPGFGYVRGNGEMSRACEGEGTTSSIWLIGRGCLGSENGEVEERVGPVG
ncbi:MAG: hypothetical protein M1358_17910 [Chloroflexi bacterium]|nr:hypothetical protein [Chloroflexota bacterium]